MLNYAIIGVGGLGKHHLSNTLEIKDGINLVALCDIDKERVFGGSDTNLGAKEVEIDYGKYRIYEDAGEMLDREKPDFVIIAVPTYLHDELAVLALNSGAHVFCEKPMAINPERCQRMIDAARANNKKLMIGQCVRFSGVYQRLKNVFETGEFGGLLRAEFYRYSGMPVWGWQNWFLDFEKSGGCALDLHVHDVDYVLWAFGRPRAVSSVATHHRARFESIRSRYYYDNGLVIDVNGDWGHGKDFQFTCGFRAVFEKAALEYGRDKFLNIYPNEGGAYKVENISNMHKEEILYFIDAISSGSEITMVTPESAKQAIELALEEIRSAETNSIVALVEAKL